eukprot:CAMPEP_0181458060 /NCGR_PEP_ID=MMETSP1110-20121109/32113_1 /TAXON_ID=174948 /ORGANISM="Symbiodinium sp., Strain CCMP421" /LENGTH=386 /DNA_ID=CAMNT_0023582533 /DNA_START=51 /DNA_END=1211 /DNA_ORIENTATION=+
MAAPRTLEQWFQQVPHLVSDQHWELAVRQHHRSLYHCACPWGGRLLKVKAGSVRESGLVRPEVRAAKCPDTKLLQHLAPGEAVLLSKDWSHVFENLAAHAPSEAKAVTQRLRRDFPEEGDSALTFEGESRGLLLCRPKDGSNELTGIFQVSEEQFTQWSSIHLMLLLDSASRGARSFLSRAEEDADFYSVLTVQSCRRGLPLIPSDPTEVATVSITAGQSAGLENWTRFSPEMTEGSRFCVADYVRTFAARLGLALATYDSLDGQRLVPYQCVVARQEWEAVQDKFVEAFLLQKKAYRRANGGSTAPSFHADVQPRSVPDSKLVELKQSLRHAEESSRPCHKVVVRRTFLEVEDEDEEEMASAQRHVRRPKTTGIVPEISLLALAF